VHVNHGELVAENTAPTALTSAPTPQDVAVNLDYGPLAAAYDVGRRLSRLGFYANQAWPLDDWELFEWRHELHDLAIIVQECSSDVLQQDAFRDTFDRFVQQLRGTFRADGHWDDVARANASLKQWGEGPSDIPLGEMCAEISNELTRTPRGMIDEFRRSFDQLLENRQRHVFRLGELIEQGANPPTIYREMLEDAVRHPQVVEQAIEPTMSWEGFLDGRHSAGGAIRSIILPTQRYDSSQRRPPEEWFADLRFKWNRCGLGEELLGEFLQPLRDSSNPSAFADHICRLHSAAMAALESVTLSEMDELAGGDTPGHYLGLRFNSRELTVNREGRVGALRFGRSRMLFNLCFELARRGDACTSMDWLRQNWAKIGKAGNPNAQTVYDALSKLGNKIQDIGISVDNAPTYGWRLIETVQGARPGRLS
jgi:hypothetical protein